MLLTFIAAISLAVFAASIAFVLRRMTGINARWLIPAAAGSAMLGFTIWNDYAWFGRTSGALPDTMVVTQTIEASRAIQPWTLAVPMINAFAALDTGSMKRNPEHPNLLIADLYILERYVPTRQTTQLIDCDAGRRADLPPNARFGDDGMPAGLDWFTLPADHALLTAACAG